ncbi:leucine-rich_repeat domain-containing protein [Hexamita inflata]|uniref:Leucine-rich repeat domain-containing protein n=1 Tax=Hexamita inflata TaxID=28002 RepID=A0AA86NBF6_9EUKA|nr:leucine-rich repeat domain-containing protein [Hexamita inflata]
MQPNQIISKKDLLNHFGSSKILQIFDLKQMEDLLKINIPPEIWDNAQNRNLLSFSQEFVQRTEEFAFNGSKIECIYLISFFINLTELSLYNNKISDISAISKLKNMKKLQLSINCIDDISALQSLTDLTHLNLSNNKLISYTLALPNLVELLLSGNKLQDIFGLKHSYRLERLDLSYAETTELSSIPHQLFGLKQLDLCKNNLKQISYLSNFVDLQCLNLGSNTHLQDIGHLKFCTQLTELRIQLTNVADIWPLQFMKNLKTLFMADTKVVDLHPLQHLNQLGYISAPHTCIIDVSPLSNLTKLYYLNLSDSKIINADILKCHNNYTRKYHFLFLKVPTIDELLFYNKILKVHSSQKQIRKIQNDKRVPKFRASLASKKNYVLATLNNQIMAISTELNLFAQLIQNQNKYLD